MTGDVYNKARVINKKIEKLNEEIQFLQAYEDNKESIVFQTNTAVPRFLYEDLKADKISLSSEEISILLKLKKNELFRLTDEFHDL